MASILVVDDDPLERGMLTYVLRHGSHDVHAGGDPQTALRTLESKVVDMVIVDIHLERADGFHLCQQIRDRYPHSPLMVVSGLRDADQIVRGLSIADDYVTKPYVPRELLARTSALLRRAHVPSGSENGPETLIIGELALDLHRMQAVVGGVSVELTPRELRLLHTLMHFPRRVLTREQIVRLAWGKHYVGSPKVVDVCVQRVRGKLAPHLLGAEFIHTVRGFGYRFEILGAPSEAASKTAKLLPTRISA